jgi:hypothetical protein
MPATITEATVACPECGVSNVEMPTNVCQCFYTCGSCGAFLKPLCRSQSAVKMPFIQTP